MKEALIRNYKLTFLEKVLAAVLLLLGIGMLYVIRTSGWLSSAKSVINNPGFLPQIVAIGLIVISVILTADSLRKDRDETVTINWFGILIVALWVLYAFLCSWLGFILSSILVLFATLFLFGAKNKRAVLLTSILAPVLLYLMLGLLLGVKLPTLFL